MKLTVKQMHGLLKHTDSPYIRAVGFLYLRYVADAKTLWTWYEPYIKDDEVSSFYQVLRVVYNYEYHFIIIKLS
jgi:hypothetical protein